METAIEMICNKCKIQVKIEVIGINDQKMEVSSE
jgi:hypothetical protein